MLKRIALSLPPIRRLYDDYAAQVAENTALHGQISRLTLDLETALGTVHDLTGQPEDGPPANAVEAVQRSTQVMQARIDELTEEARVLELEFDALRSIHAADHEELAALRVRIAELEQDKLAATKAQAELVREVALLREVAGARLDSDGTPSGNGWVTEEVGRLANHMDNLAAAAGNSVPAIQRAVQNQVAGLQSVLQSDRQLLLAGIQRMLARSADGGLTTSDQSARWLDLMEQLLTGTLFADRAISPWSGDDYDPTARLLGRDWPATAMTMIGVARMRNLRALCEQALADDVPGDLLEAGVWRGGACIYMKAMLTAHGSGGRRVFVADSFRGLPPPDPERYPADAGDTHHEVAELAISRADVEDNFRTFGLLDDDVIFLEGWFKDTLPTAPVEQLAILRLDGDMYESTMDALNALYHKVSPGGFVIVDDYVLEPCAEAVNAFRDTHGISAPMVEVDGAAVYWRVPTDA